MLFSGILSFLFGILFLILFEFNVIAPSFIALFSIPQACIITFMGFSGLSLILYLESTKSSLLYRKLHLNSRILAIIALIITIIAGSLILVYGTIEVFSHVKYYERNIFPLFTVVLELSFLIATIGFLLIPLAYISQFIWNTIKKYRLRHNLFNSLLFVKLGTIFVSGSIIIGLGVATYGGFSIGLQANPFPMSFNAPAYDFPTGLHFNSTWDTPIFNQTLISALEKGLWKITTIQQAGGFPMVVKADGSRYYGDRGSWAPYYPGEFSLQRSTGYIGKVFLRMYEVEPNPIYLAVASKVAKAILAVQDEENGGFYYDGRIRKDGTPDQPHRLNPSRSAILDDNTMQSCIEFLLDYYQITSDPAVYNSIMKGFACLDAMETPVGGWMQRSNYDLDEYPSYVTLNDQCMLNTYNLYLKAYSLFNQTRFLDPAIRAAGFLINAQGSGGSALQQVWAEQYTWDRLPAWGRNFEPKGFSPDATVNAIRMLITTYLLTNESRYLDPIEGAVLWLNDPSTYIISTKNGTLIHYYARIYELKTNHPIYGIANGGEGRCPEYTYQIEKARPGYDWMEDWGVYHLLVDIANFTSVNWSQTAMYKYLNEEFDEKIYRQLAYDALNNQGESGFWYNEAGQIEDRYFWTNANQILDYLNYIGK